MNVDDLRANLQTADSAAPEVIRRHTLDRLVEAFDAKLGMFFKVARIDGDDHYTEMETRGPDSELGALYGQWADEPMLDSPWGPAGPNPSEVNRFVCPREEHDLDEYDVHDDMNAEYDVYDQVRALMYDGPRFLGWFGIMRRGQKRMMGTEEARRATWVVDEVKANLAAAQSLEDRRRDPDRALYALLRPDGTIAQLSRRAIDWLDDERRELIRDWVRTFDRSGEAPTVLIDSGCELRMIRLDGEEGVRYLVDIDRAFIPRLDPLEILTERQREVAEYVAVGATNAEIARTLDVSRSTIKYHLRQIYQRLQVDTRPELAQLV